MASSRASQAPPDDDRDSGEVLASFLRRGFRSGPDSELRVTLDAFNGHPFIGLRVWNVGRGGVMTPSKKGVSVRPAEAKKVAEAILEALAKCPSGDPRPARPRVDRDVSRASRRRATVAGVLAAPSVPEPAGDEASRRDLPPWEAPTSTPSTEPSS